jgi:hypothetical protein
MVGWYREEVRAHCCYSAMDAPLATPTLNQHTCAHLSCMRWVSNIPTPDLAMQGTADEGVAYHVS